MGPSPPSLFPSHCLLVLNLKDQERYLEQAQMSTSSNDHNWSLGLGQWPFLKALLSTRFPAIYKVTFLSQSFGAGSGAELICGYGTE